VDETHVNLELLRSGWARLLVIPPNEKHTEALAAAQREAVEAERGLWRKPMPPAGT
jgi:micrococcal nuclease